MRKRKRISFKTLNNKENRPLSSDETKGSLKVCNKDFSTSPQGIGSSTKGTADRYCGSKCNMSKDHSTNQRATNAPYLKFAVDTDADPLLRVCGVPISSIEIKSLHSV